MENIKHCEHKLKVKRTLFNEHYYYRHTSPMRLHMLAATALPCLVTLICVQDELFLTALTYNLFLFGQMLFLWSLWCRRTNWKLLIPHQLGILAAEMW